MKITTILLVCLCSVGVGCASKPHANDDPLREYSVTCLKRGLAVNTPEHTDCVIALHHVAKAQQAQLQKETAPAAPAKPEPAKVTSQ